MTLKTVGHARKLTLSASALLVLGLAACSNGQTPEPEQQSALDRLGQRTEAAANEAGEAMTDGMVTTKVKAQLAAAGGVSAMDIGVETDRGVVTLSGTVKSDAERELAISIAESVEGVEDVHADGLTVA